MLTYREGDSAIHRLSGAVKFLVFLLWSILAMAGYDTPVMLAMTALGVVFFIIARIRLRDVSFIFRMLGLFMFFNLVCIYLFAPEQGVAIYGARHLIWEGIGRYTLTQEQLFYEFNVLLKYGMIVPSAILLIVTTEPSEFASSLNKLGVPYSVAYAVSLSLRYIPDVQKDYENISHAQQARGVELSRKVSLWRRVKGAGRILMPLVFSSLERIDVISRAMELRGFGKYKKRTWYAERPFSRLDGTVLVVALILFVCGLWLTFRDGNRFFNPFSS
jgi:energy-coupling factor transport system permease protein